ncbi:hypothetical protein PFISCL1PPCAC_1566 [Pristionchus fissidentatus]|uniref:VPS9 domain-containing protein n=1 Tax=Pristionchus fissidentatus TaxID=1538716 RepID=A0AAV5UX27_9BILA|nr:hypothetical protein PFISCL1PPCAC_1566 [Pristionchus fissidentatus]
MTSTWLATPIAATRAGTPLPCSQDSLPTLLEEDSTTSLEDYFVSEQDSSVLDRFTLVAHFPPAEDCVISHIHSGYGTTVICFDDGRVSIGTGSLLPRSIYSTPKACEHGIKERATRQIYALSTVCSEAEVVVVTKSDGLWTFPIDCLEPDEEATSHSESLIYARQLCHEKCLSLKAGSDFFVAIVDNSKQCDESTEEHIESIDDEPEFSLCKSCNENKRMRLSHLMREADREAEESEKRAATVRFRESRSSIIDDRRTALLWNGLEHSEREQGGGRVPSMLALSHESAADDGISIRAVRGDSPIRTNRRRRESSTGSEQRDWLGRGEERRREIPIKISVLTWGANGSGQLGHGDNVQRSQPQSIAAFDAAKRVCSIATGNAHAAALTAAGTAFVWGANVWSDEKSTVLSPTLFKTGESSSVLDVTACEDSIGVLVVDKEGSTSILLARCGGVSRIGGVGKGMTTIGIRLMQDGRMLLRTKEKESFPSLSMWRESIELCKLLSNLDELGKHCLQERIKQNSTFSLDSLPSKGNKKSSTTSTLGTVAESSKLIRKLNKSLSRFATMATVHAEQVRDAFRAGVIGNTVVRDTVAFDVLNSPRFRSAFGKFVDAYVTTRAYGALEALPFSSESSIRFVDRISLTYDVTSTRSDSVVRKLFSLPLEFLRRSVDEFVKLTEDTSDSAPSGYASEWSHQLQEAAAVMEMAAATAVWWRREGNNTLARSLHKSRRVLVWNGGTGSEGGLLSVVARSAGILSARYTQVLVFNDLVVFATRNSDQRFPTQLVWMSEKKDETAEKRVLYVDTPDEKFDLEFASKEDRDLFKRRVSFWYWSNFAVETRSTRPSSSSSSSLVFGSPPLTRKADRFVFAKTGEAYAGEWRNGVPHGSGRKTTSACTYEGSFVDGLPHGFGVLSVPVEDPSTSSSSTLFYVPREEPTKGKEKRDDTKCTVIRGNFEKGKARGLCKINTATGTVYRGYVEEGVPHGFGEELKKEEHYIGFFSKGKPHGYGVSSELNELGTIRRKYLGQFEEGSMQGEGAMIDGCGAYCEGEFKADQMKFGRLQCPPTEGEMHSIEYRGEFNGWRLAMGKGTLEVSPTLRITGKFNYAILGDDGTTKRSEEADIVDAKIETRRAVDRLKEVFHGEGAHIEHYSEAEEMWNWRPLVDLFLKEEMGQEKRGGRRRDDSGEMEIEMDSLRSSEDEERVREAWKRVQMTIERRKKMEGGEGIEDIDVSHVASAASLRPWSSGYYEMVRSTWTEAIEDPLHPIARLAHTWVQIYQASFGGALGAHRCVHEKAASELRLILYSVYGVMRVLFPNLPVNPLDSIPEEASPITATGSQETLFTVDGLSLADIEYEDGNSVETETASVRSIPSALCSLLPSPPVIDFLYSHFFSLLHPIILPIYIVSTAEFDDVYWSKIVYLNAHTDVKLLSFLDVPRCIWPIDLENPEDLGAAVICNTARYRFYESAIKMLQNIPTRPNPLDKLRILAETFVEMNSCVEAHGESKKPLWEADTLMPAFIYVVVRAGIKHLGAEIRLIEDFSSQMHNGPIGPMFTYLKSAFVYICMQSDVA